MKNFLRIFVFLFCFSFFGCLGIIDESLISSVSFEITIPESIEKQSTSARTATTDNLKLIVDLETKDSEEVRTEEKNVSEGETVSISFEEIPVESEIRLVGKLFDSESNVLYSGESEWVVIQSGKNEVNLVMKKEIIVDAAEPTEVMDLASTVFVKGSDVTSTILQCSGMSTDEGVITFQWQVQNANGEWETLEARGNQQALNLYVSILDVFATDFEVNEVKNYRCIVTNTNDKVNGNKTASVTKTATIACVEGIFSSMTAEYKKGCYEIFGTAFTYENIIVKEKWISGENSFEFTVPASNTRYEVKQNSTPAGESESVIGAVPYTITYKGGYANAETSLSQELTIPVKYQLKPADLQLSSYFNDSYVSTSEDGKTLKVPQYGTVEYELTLPESVCGGLTIIKFEGESEYIKDLTTSCDYYSTTIYKDGTLIENDASCEVAGVYKYKLAIKSENEWFVCEENNTKEFDVEVCTWNMSVTGTTKNDSGEFVLNDTSTTQCSVSATNEAISNITVYFYDGDELTDGTIIFDAPTTTQRKEIIAKVGSIEVGTVVVIIPGPEAGSISNPITSWGDLVTAMQNEGGDIYIKGSLTADSTLNIEKDRAIIANGPVTITRAQNFNGTLINVNNNFVLKGENDNSLITIDENGVPAEKTIISTNYNVSLEYVTMTNCNSPSCNGIIDVSNSEILSLKNCSFLSNSITNTVYISGENIAATIENCFFSDSCVDLSIINANSVCINNSSFDQDNTNNLSITKCPTLELGENLKIPLIYYNNSDVTNSELDILCKETTSLLDENIPIYLSLVKYENDDAFYDLDLFADDQNIPNSVFAIKNPNYVLNTSTGVVEPVSSGESGSESSNAVVDVNTLKNAIDSANGSEAEPYVIKIAATESGLIDISESITINSHIKFVPAGSSDITLSRNGGLTDQNLFVVSGNASLTIGDDTSTGSIIIDGGSENNITSTKSLINVASGGKLILNKNCVLQNNTCPDNYSSSNGSAVYSNGGTIEINGAKICNNKVMRESKSGGGIYLINGSFCMNSGTFEVNSVSATGNNVYGGAIALYSCDLIQINGGTFYKNVVSATNTECYGGAIFISDAPTGTTISNCFFNQNEAYQKGAAIYFGGTTAGTVAISSCNFSGNSITNTDGTVSDIFVGNSSCTVTVEENQISDAWSQ